MAMAGGWGRGRQQVGDTKVLSESLPDIVSENHCCPSQLANQMLSRDHTYDSQGSGTPSDLLSGGIPMGSLTTEETPPHP